MSVVDSLFIGAWRLITFEFQKDDDTVIYPYGREAQGSLIYTENGRYSAQLMRRDRPRFALPDQMQGTVKETEEAFKGCISYFGSYTVDEENSLIVHRVEGSLFPNMEGSNQIRLFELSETQLILRTPPIKLDGDTAVGILQWKRIG
jgi:hypothetical protein